MTCADCQQPAKHVARGLCSVCYERNRYRGTHTRHHDTTRQQRREHIVNRYLELERPGTRVQAAAQLGVSRKTLQWALETAARAGDTRIDYTPRKPPMPPPPPVAVPLTLPTLPDAACAQPGVDAEWFFAKDGKRAGHHAVYPPQAKQTCNRCPALQACHEWALTQGPGLDGYWANTTPDSRADLRRAAHRRAS